MGWNSILTTGGKLIAAAAPVVKAATPKVVSAAASAGKAIGHTAIKNPLLAAVAWVYMKKDDGEGLVSAASSEIFGEDTVKNGGILQAVRNAAFGEDNSEKSIAENVTDSTLGEGTYQGGINRASEAYHDAKDYASQAYHGAKDFASEAYHDAKDLAHQGVAFVRDSVSGQSAANVQQGQLLYDAEGNIVGTYPGAGAYNPQQIAAMQNTNPFSSMGSFVSQMSGGKVTGLNALEIMVAAYMLFGSRFGWLGKIAGALIGGTAAKDITNRSARIQQQQMQNSSYAQQLHYQPQSSYQQPPQSSGEEYTVSRGRGI